MVCYFQRFSNVLITKSKYTEKESSKQFTSYFPLDFTYYFITSLLHCFITYVGHDDLTNFG